MSKVIEITDFSAPELDIYARLTENQLVNRADPESAMFVAESPVVIERALDAGCVPVSFLMEKKHVYFIRISVFVSWVTFAAVLMLTLAAGKVRLGDITVLRVDMLLRAADKTALFVITPLRMGCLGKRARQIC